MGAAADFPIVVDVEVAGGVRKVDDLESAFERLERQVESVDAQLLKMKQTAGTAVQGGAGKAADQLQRQAELFKSIRGPILDYQQNMQALSGLYQRGSISAGEFRAKQTELAAQFKRSSAGATDMASKLDRLQGVALRLAAAYAAVRAAQAIGTEVAELSDRYTSLSNQLRQVVDSEEELGDVRKRLLAEANETGSSVEALATLYARTDRALSKLGFTSHEVENFTENLNKALKTGGLATQEQAAAMLQLSQALNKGKLDGDEFKTVAEAFPQILDIVAKKMGVASTEVQSLASQGKISAKVLAEAVLDSTAEIQDAFDKRVPTASEQVQKLENTILFLVGQLAEGLGPALGDIADHLIEMANDIGPVVQGFVEFGGELAQVAASSIVNTLELIVINLQAAKKAAEDFGGVLSQLGDSEDMLKSLAGGFGGLAKELKATDRLYDNVIEGVKRGAQATRDDIRAQEARTAAEKKANDDRRRAIDIAGDQTAKIKVTTKELLAIQREQEAAARRATAEQDRFAKALQQVIDASRPVDAALRKQAEAEALLDRAVQQHMLTLEEAEDVASRWAFVNRDSIDPLGAVKRSLEEQAAALYAVTQAQKDELEVRRIRLELMMKGVDVTHEDEVAIRGLIAALHDAEKAAQGLIQMPNVPIISDEELERSKKILEGTKRDFTELTKNEFQTMGVEATNALRDLRDELDLTIDSFGESTNALLDFVNTGKGSWAGFRDALHQDIEAILRDLERYLIKQAIAGLAGLVTGGFGGGIPSGAPALSYPGGYAEGGSFTVGGQPGRDRNFFPMFLTRGEHVQIRTESQVKQDRRADYGGGGGGMMGGVSITNVLDPRGSVGMINTPSGDREMFNWIRTHSEAIRSILR